MYDNTGNTEGENAEASNDSPAWFRNRRKLEEQDLKNLHPHLRSKYLAVCKNIMQTAFSLVIISQNGD